MTATMAYIGTNADPSLITATVFNDTHEAVAGSADGTGHTHTGLGTNGRVIPGTQIIEVYTGTAFNVNQTAVGSSENTHELNAVGSAVIGDSNYLVVDLLIQTESDSNSSGRSTSEMKIQTKETGSAYQDSLVYTTISDVEDLSSKGVFSLRNIRWVHTLTALEKTSGVQAKVFARGTITVGVGVANVTNVQTTQKVMY